MFAAHCVGCKKSAAAVSSLATVALRADRTKNVLELSPDMCCIAESSRLLRF